MSAVRHLAPGLTPSPISPPAPQPLQTNVVYPQIANTRGLVLDNIKNVSLLACLGSKSVTLLRT